MVCAPPKYVAWNTWAGLRTLIWKILTSHNIHLLWIIVWMILFFITYVWLYKFEYTIILLSTVFDKINLAN